MKFIIVDEDGLIAMEGVPGEPVLLTVADANRVIEACLSARTRAVLLHPANLTPAFFDLSSGDAGAILQKLRTYGVRLAIVCPPGQLTFSRRFGEMLAEEARGPYFRVYGTRAEARAWLAKVAG
jgi:hypothetical protein